MKQALLVMVIYFVARPCFANTELTSEEQKVVYAIGLALSRSANNFNLSAEELDLVKLGLTDGVSRHPKVDILQYLPKVDKLAKERMEATRQEQKRVGSAFLARAAAEPGAVQTISGLVITTLDPGSGDSPKLTDTVVIGVKGLLTDGALFGSSMQQGQSLTFLLAGALPCWKEGLTLMKAGGKSRLVCPPELTYGTLGGPQGTRPGATLVFEIELLDIVKKGAKVSPDTNTHVQP